MNKKIELLFVLTCLIGFSSSSHIFTAETPSKKSMVAATEYLFHSFISVPLYATLTSITGYSAYQNPNIKNVLHFAFSGLLLAKSFCKQQVVTYELNLAKSNTYVENYNAIYQQINSNNHSKEPKVDLAINMTLEALIEENSKQSDMLGKKLETWKARDKKITYCMGGLAIAGLGYYSKDALNITGFNKISNDINNEVTKNLQHINPLTLFKNKNL